MLVVSTRWKMLQGNTDLLISRILMCCLPRFLASSFSVSWFTTSKTVSKMEGNNYVLALYIQENPIFDRLIQICVLMRRKEKNTCNFILPPFGIDVIEIFVKTLILFCQLKRRRKIGWRIFIVLNALSACNKTSVYTFLLKERLSLL